MKYILLIILLFVSNLSKAQVLMQEVEDYNPFASQNTKSDTILTCNEKTVKALSQTVFYNIEKRKNIYYNFRAFAFYIFIALIALFAFARSQFRNHWLRYFKDFSNLNIAKQSYRDGYLTFSWQDMAFNLIFLLSISFSLSALVLRGEEVGWSLQLSTFVLCVAIVGSILIFRNILLRGIAMALPMSDVIKFYIYNISLIYKVSVFFLLPVCLLQLLYFPLPPLFFIVFNILIISIIIVLGWIKGARLVYENISGSNLHYILYFCTFEILLVLVFAKWTTQWLTL